MKKEITTHRWPEEEFWAEREKVLSLWPTGKEIDLVESVAYLQNLPVEKKYAYVVAQAKKEGRTLVQPRGGVALIDDHLALLQHLQDRGGADLLPTTTDTYTRNLKFAAAQRGIEESKKAGRSLLNGCPIVNHGLRAVRQISEAVRRPIIVLSGTAFPQLTAEMGFAGGFTAFLGGGISYTAAYTKDLPFAAGIRNYQYVDRLAAYYEEKGVRLHREQPGFLTGTLIPPGIGIAVAVLEMLLGAAQGVKHYSMGLCQNLNPRQDVAALRALEEVAQEYLMRFNYNNFFFSIATHQWMQAFPQDEPRAYAVIILGGFIAVLAGATQIITKTTHEAEGIPTKEANADGVLASRMAISLLRQYRLPEDQAFVQEKEIIKKEARAIINKALELGEGDVAQGVIRAIQAGVMDIPWAPNTHMAGKVIPVRDATGAVRYLETGHLPFDQEILAYHREKISERTRKDGQMVDYETAVKDITEVSKMLEQ